MIDWMPRHKAGLFLTHNEHRGYYETAAEFIENRELADDFESPEAMQKAIDDDSIWILQWYPDTPIGSHRIAASSLEEIQQILKETEYE